jgi:hypothetical protein
MPAERGLSVGKHSAEGDKLVVTMEGIVIPDISQLSAHALHSILQQLASAISQQQAVSKQHFSELQLQLSERPTVAQATSLFSVSPAPEFVHLGALQSLAKSIREEITQLRDQFAAHEVARKQDQQSVETHFAGQLAALRADIGDIHHAILSSKRRNDNAYLAKKEKARKVEILKGWIEVHQTCARQRTFLKRFFQLIFKHRLGRKFGDWKHASVSVRLKNVEMNISRCSIISQDCSKQLAVLKEE